MVDLYHRSARDGILELLKTATKRDANRRDEDGMTPVHYAASCGNVEALRLLVGKGGDPDKPTFDGATACHLAAGCGQVNCLSFLTNFGANIWAWDNEGHTPLEEAAMHARMDCVRHLDGLIAIQMLQNKKEVERLKRHAKREAIKRIKKQTRMQHERDKAYERKVKKEGREGHQCDTLSDSPSSKRFNEDWDKYSTKSAGVTNGMSHNGHRFSELAGVSNYEDDASEIDARSTRSHAWSDTLVAKSKFLGALRAKISTVRKKPPHSENGVVLLTKRTSVSEPNLFKMSNPVNGQSTSCLGRSPSIDFDHESNASNEMDKSDLSIGHMLKKFDDRGNVMTQIHYNKKETSKASDSIASRTSHMSHSSHMSYATNDMTSLQSAGFEENNYSDTQAESTEMRAVVSFLAGLNLEQFASPILKESIDLNALLLCDDKDLQSIGLPLGPRRKILEAIRRRNMVLRYPGVMTDSKI